MQFRLCRVRTSGRPAEAPLPDTRREGIVRADLVRGVAWMRRGRTNASRCSCGHHRGCVRHVPRATAGRLMLSKAAIPSRKIASQENQRPRSPSAAVPSRAKGHAATAHRHLNRSLPMQPRVAERRGFGCLPCVDLARVQGSCFQPQSDRLPVAPSCAAQVAANGGRAPTGRQEIGKCPTKCSSMRRIRRRPGWLFCAAIVSRNSISSPPAVSNFAATSIWPR